jgi:hypothetical protein
MSHNSNNNNNDVKSKEECVKEEKNNENLEDLLRNLHKQIKSTKWLEENNAEKFEQENPELIKAWNEAINKTS